MEQTQIPNKDDIMTPLQVFGDDPNGSGRKALFEDIQAKIKAGGPAWHSGTYSVLENAFLGIPGGWDVEVLWIFHSTCSRQVSGRGGGGRPGR